MIKMSCSTLSFDGFEDIDYQKTFEQAKGVGYDCVEFNCWYPRTLLPSTIRSIKKRCSETGIEPISLQIGDFGAEGHLNQTRDVCHKVRAIDAAIELGCNMVVASGSTPIGGNGGIEAIIETAKLIAPIAEEKGVMICLEHHADCNMRTEEDLERILNAVPSESIAVCLDIGHADAAGIDINRMIDLFGDKIKHIHLKENGQFGQMDFKRFGEGKTESIYRAIEKMISIGYSGYLNVELSPQIGDGRPFTLDDLKKPIALFSQYENQ